MLLVFVHHTQRMSFRHLLSRVTLQANRVKYTSQTRRAHHSNMDVRLTEVEDRICMLLDGCTRWMKETQEMDTSCRIAGGWVRDKVNLQCPHYPARGST